MVCDYIIENCENGKRKISLKSNIHILSKKQFEKLEDKTVLGEICLKASKREIISRDFDVISVVALQTKDDSCYLDSQSGNRYKFYKVKKSYSGRILGYALIGEDKYIRVRKRNIYWILIPILLALLMCTIFVSCPKNQNNILNMAKDTLIQQDNSSISKNIMPNCDYCVLPSSIQLSKTNRNIQLKNLESNKDKWLISYEVCIDGKRICETGAIKPGYMVTIDLYEKTDPGKHLLTCTATQYFYTNKKGGFETAPIKQKFQTNLYIE